MFFLFKLKKVPVKLTSVNFESLAGFSRADPGLSGFSNVQSGRDTEWNNPIAVLGNGLSLDPSDILHNYAQGYGHNQIRRGFDDRDRYSGHAQGYANAGLRGLGDSRLPIRGISPDLAPALRRDSSARRGINL